MLPYCKKATHNTREVSADTYLDGTQFFKFKSDRYLLFFIPSRNNTLIIRNISFYQLICPTLPAYHSLIFLFMLHYPYIFSKAPYDYYFVIYCWHVLISLLWGIRLVMRMWCERVGNCADIVWYCWEKVVPAFFVHFAQLKRKFGRILSRGTASQGRKEGKQTVFYNKWKYLTFSGHIGRLMENTQCSERIFNTTV